MKLSQLIMVGVVLGLDILLIGYGLYDYYLKSKMRYVDYIDEEGRIVHVLERVYDD